MNGYVLSAMLSLLDRVTDAIQRVSDIDPVPTPPALAARGFDDNAYASPLSSDDVTDLVTRSSFAAVLRYMEEPYFFDDGDAAGLRESLVEALRSSRGTSLSCIVCPRPDDGVVVQSSQRERLLVG